MLFILCSIGIPILNRNTLIAYISVQFELDNMMCHLAFDVMLSPVFLVIQGFNRGMW